MPKPRSIPLLDLAREYSFVKKDVQKQLAQCLSSQEWILGRKVKEFEKKTAKYLGVRFAVGVASGTDALLLSLRALAIKKKKKQFFDRKDEIITTPFTFIATAEAIERSGAKAVFVDIDPATFTIDPVQIKKAVNKNTVGILPVHLYGHAANMKEILKIARRKGLFVLEDAAQSFGGSYGKKKLGSLGDCGALSFFPSKNLAGFGDAGMITTNDAFLAKTIRILRNHGEATRYNARYIAYNSRLDAIQAGVLLAKLKYIDKFNSRRRRAAGQYSQALKGIAQISIPRAPKEVKHSYCLYTIRALKKRDRLCKFLNSKGVGSRVYYPRPLYRMKAFKGARRIGSLKATKQASLEALSLPIHPFLNKGQIDHIARLIRGFFNK